VIDRKRLLDGWVFCPRCSAPLEFPEIDGLPRPTCRSCGYVYYRNPGVGAATLAYDERGRVLLVRRDDSGRWCLPCGYCEWGEEVREAAVRECMEETGYAVEVGEVAMVRSNFHDPGKPTVGIWFHARVTGGFPRAGDDATEVGWFDLDALPDLAFPGDEELLHSARH
jgi:8-oxo-dGTP diphosphatase